MKSEFWMSRTARLWAFSLAIRLIVSRPRQCSCFSTSCSMSRMSTVMRRSTIGAASGQGGPVSRDRLLLFQCANLLPVVAELEEDVLGVLAELGDRAAGGPARVGEVDRGRYHARRAALGEGHVDEGAAGGGLRIGDDF